MRYTFPLPIVFYAFFTFTGQVLGQSRAPRNPPACPQLDLTPKVWMDLQMNEYLEGYPNIDKITLPELAAQVGAPNFPAGIGLHPNVGQMCHPVVDRNWVLMVAIQKWNSNLNNLYASINAACEIVKTEASTIVKDFLDDTVMESSMIGWAIATLVIGILGAMIAPLAPIFAPKAIVQAVVTYRSEASLSEAAVTYAATRAAADSRDLVLTAHLMEARDVSVISEEVSRLGSRVHPLPATPPPGSRPLNSPSAHITPLAKRSQRGEDSPLISRNSVHYKRLYPRGKLEKRGKPPPSAYAFDVFANLQTHVSGLQKRLLNVVDELAELGNTKPIWSNDGLASVVYDGAMFGNLPTQIQNQKDQSEFAKLTVLSEFFASQNYFVTVDSDKCNDKGPRGAWSSKDFLSYCTPQGSMRNIIRAEGIHARNKFKNVKLLTSNYFSVEFLTNKAIECQQKHGLYTEQKFPPPENIKSDCVFAIPVCDCKIPAVKHKREKKHGTVTACRDGAGLPI